MKDNLEMLIPVKCKVTMIVGCEINIPGDKIDEILQDFREVIKGDADKEDLIKHIAWTMAKGRYTDVVEGVGSLKELGIRYKQFEEDDDVEIVKSVRV
jgi:hypothetical protein